MNASAVPLSDTGTFLTRFAMSAMGVVGVLAAVSPVRESVTALTIWSVFSSSSLAGLRAWPGEGGLLTFFAPDGAAFSYRIIEECNAVAVVGLFVVGVLAIPGVNWRRRGAGIAVGATALLVANWIRLLNLAWIGVHHPAYFDLAHVWVWQAIGMVLVVAFWAIWMRWATGRPAGQSTLWQRAVWFAGVVGLGALAHLMSGAERYSHVVDAAVGGVAALVQALPYETLTLGGPVDEWRMQVRGVSLVFAVALTAALVGPTTRQRLVASAQAVPLIFLAQALATLVERMTDARLDPDQWAIPILVVLYGLPLLVPVALGYRSLAASEADVPSVS